MSGRLKKRLDNAGVDLSSARLNESFCLVSAPSEMVYTVWQLILCKSLLDWDAFATSGEDQGHRRIRASVEARRENGFIWLERIPSDVYPFLRQVRDEQGRRRLHGAFTGGFSAGYYNSVGSKEGSCDVFICMQTSDGRSIRLGAPDLQVFTKRTSQQEGCAT